MAKSACQVLIMPTLTGVYCRLPSTLSRSMVLWAGHRLFVPVPGLSYFGSAAVCQVPQQTLWKAGEACTSSCIDPEHCIGGLEHSTVLGQLRIFQTRGKGPAMAAVF